MTYTPNPSPAAQPGHPSPQPPAPGAVKRSTILWLAIGIPVGVILLLAIIAALIFAWFSFAPAKAVDRSATLEGAQSVSIDAPNATLNLLASTDGQVHVTMTGSHTGQAPTLKAEVAGTVAQIDAECPRFWFFSRCDVTVTVALPASLNVAAHGINGRITVSDLAGDIRLETTNGSIEATGTSGSLGLITTNGSVRVQEATSAAVHAETINGSVELGFIAAPEDISATSTNGAITVRVPDDGTRYAVTASTVLGRVDTASVPTDPTATHTITAETVNGAIRVAAGGR
ncbi:DUF4097 family beta strand repeat-containing protein [Homoserinimonas sp. OAct 916]|uniref:DUF4097 family beta strand repeat-containing protein n=1 Tax=Homoserinimonas sp. OAct 916 TaxID=2211450 RepID=UPI000DBE19E9|nr:DUF4097 family beta strand repeat-containing protein [Homoserinimonas sp. OAct 916]